MIPSLLLTPIQNRYIAYFFREIIHNTIAKDYFIQYMGKQSNPLDTAAYALTFDFDFEKDIDAFPLVLDLLKQYGIKAGLAVIGKFVEKYPEIHKRAVAEGHELINHSYTHPDNPHWAPGRFFNKLSFQEQKEEIQKAHEAIARITGYNCVGFRTPHYGNLHTQSVYPILAELGYKYSSSTAACAFKGFGAPSMHTHGIIEIPTGCSLNFPFAIFDSWNMLRKKNPFLKNDDAFIHEFEATIQTVKKNNMFITHYFDPYDVISNGKLQNMLETLKKVKTVLYRDILTEN